MKLHLPKAVICSVLMSAMVSTVWADAVIVTPNTIVGKDVDGNSVDVTIDGDSEIPTAWKDYHEATGTYGVYAQAYLKDGVNSTLTIKNLGTADTAVEVNSPLYIREGSAKISDSNIVTKTWSPVNQAMIQVAGNNAGLTLTNTSYIYKSWESSIHVGGPDGSGSLTLDNSTVRVMTIWAGLTENSTFKDVYVYNATTESTDSTSERYSNGVYQTVTDANGTTRNFGEADIKITNGSKVHLLSNAELGQGTMTVDNATVEVGSCVWLGRVDGAKSVLNVVNGGVITGSSESAGFLYTCDSGYGVTPGTTSVEVNVKGEGSKIDLGKTMKFTAPDSKMNITESGSVSAGWVIFSRDDEQAGSVAVNVGAGSTLEATYSLTAYSGTEIDNAGSMSAAELTLEGALLTNRGNIMIDGAMSMTDGATLNLVITDFANLPSLTVESLSVTEGASLGLIFDNLTLADEAMASLMGAQMLGTDGEAVDFTNLIKITGAGALQDAIDADTSLSLFYYGDNGEVLEYTAGTNEQVSVGIAQVASIPEPTTATLSLLALAALAARRRR